MDNSSGSQEIANTIIVPAYNEEEGLPVVLGKLFNLIDRSYEVIVVDDGSTDGTAKAASRFPCRLVRHELNRGKGETLKTGIKEARGVNIIWIDADNTYPAESIPQIAEALRSHEMVVGSRINVREHMPGFNRLGNWIFRTMIRKIYGFKAHDPCTGLYGVRKRHLERMGLSSKRFAIEPEVSIKGSRMKLRMVEVPIEYRPRIGDSKLSVIKVGFEDLQAILSLIFWRPD